jgi:hypothetical protein
MIPHNNPGAKQKQAMARVLAAAQAEGPLCGYINGAHPRLLVRAGM